jgi:hypothetical protein
MNRKAKQDTMLSLLVLYAPKLAFLQRWVTLLNTWGLWTSKLLLLDLLLLRKDSHNDGSYM